jgi:hypothetical protein
MEAFGKININISRPVFCFIGYNVMIYSVSLSRKDIKKSAKISINYIIFFINFRKTALTDV